MKKIVLFTFLFISMLYSQKTPAKSSNLLPKGDMEELSVDSNPWDGVYSGSLRVFVDNSFVVQTTGNLTNQPFPPSVKAADLNGDELKDLIVSDSKGIFWVFFNIGTKKDPRFNRGEILPIRLNDNTIEDGGGASVPKIHPVDFTGDGLVDLVIGNFEGKLYFVRNTGTASSPKFYTPLETKSFEVKTDSKDRLWCNYLAPYYYDWDRDGKMDLIMGEGTFSANNIFFLKNTGSNERPVFDPPQLMIASQGREHLVPQVIDWNEDGKPDLVFGEREKGMISVALYKDKFPLEKPTEIKVGSAADSSPLANPCFEDMNDDGLPDLLIGTTSGTIRMAINKGKKGAPLFDKLNSVKGESSYPSILKNSNWRMRYTGEQGTVSNSRFFLLRALSKKDRFKTEKNLVGYDPQLELPPESTGQSCLFFEFVEPTQKIIKETPRFVHDPQKKLYSIQYDQPIPLKPEVDYELSFYIKGSGFSDCRVKMLDQSHRKKLNDGQTAGEVLSAISQEHFNLSTAWQLETKKIRCTREKGEKAEAGSFTLSFEFIGDGNFYLDDVVLVESKKQ